MADCPDCGAEISGRAISCPRCGADRRSAWERAGCLGQVGIVVLIVFGFMAVLAAFQGLGLTQ